MGKLLFLISFLTWPGTPNHSYGVEEDRKAFLAGTGKKTWYLYARTPADGGPTCQATHPIATDNTYTFFANGNFEFDHGAIHEDVACQEGDCCSDLVNLSGTWKFTDGKTHIRIKVQHETGNTGNAIDMVLYDATIVQLDNDIFTLTQTDGETNTVYSFEFRRK